MDPKEIIELLLTTARSLGAEVTSPWFYLQLGLMLAAAGIAFGVGAAVRSRVDMTSLGMGWPATPARASFVSTTCALLTWSVRWRWR